MKLVAWGLTAALALALAGCKGDKGDKGDPGAPGIQGPAGVAGQQGPAGPLPDVSYVGRMLEAEGPGLSATTTTGVTGDDPTASRGKVRFAPGSGAAGRVWAVSSSDLGGLLGTGRTDVSLRAKVTSALSSAVLAKVSCLAQRAGEASPTAVSPAFEIHPNEFLGGVWREVSFRCEFRPDDVTQWIAVDDFASGVTDLSLDTVRVTPLPSSTRVLGRVQCDGACSARPAETLQGWAVVKGATVDQQMKVTVTVGAAPVLAQMTASFSMNPGIIEPYCGIRVRDAAGAEVALAHIGGTTTPSSTATWFTCSGGYLFDLPSGRYTFEALGWVNATTAVSWALQRQLAIIEL